MFGAVALGPLDDFESDLLALGEGAASGHLDFGLVREDIARDAIGLNEAEALRVIEPFDFSVHGEGGSGFSRFPCGGSGYAETVSFRMPSVLVMTVLL